jgi:hypothetical protein
VYAVGAETQTFNIAGVKEHSCFMKELKDAEKVCGVPSDFGHYLWPCIFSFALRSWIVSPYVFFPNSSHPEASKGIESAAMNSDNPNAAADVDRLLHMGLLAMISPRCALFEPFRSSSGRGWRPNWYRTGEYIFLSGSYVLTLSSLQSGELHDFVHDDLKNWYPGKCSARKLQDIGEYGC